MAHIFALLEAVQQRLAEVLEDALDPATRQVGLRRLRLLQLIPEEGASQTELAALSGVTKQALTDHIAALESSGLISRTPGAADRRAWHVRRTPRGDAACVDLREAITQAERHLVDVLGAKRARSILAALDDVAAASASRSGS